MAHVGADVESARDKKEYLRGFSDFSHFIASDYSLSIYRKFAVLGARNLLYLQGELQLLEIQLAELDDADKKIIGFSQDLDQALEVEKAARSWEDMDRLANEGDEEKRKKLKVIYKIRKVMKEYGSCLADYYSKSWLTFCQRTLYYDGIKFCSLKSQKRNLSRHLKRGSEGTLLCYGEAVSDFSTRKKI